eukprot:TRINITY_DN25784_c0_g1_i4.p2 TRINITY_DN25784_c0_g1~~TRINITY_DN25784_c0_g1_i4.p2  ORF type:complete len:104 (+),score=19.80 TRINITY_DN25784_c0_g1_i4:156-467(+)
MQRGLVGSEMCIRDRQYDDLNEWLFFDYYFEGELGKYYSDNQYENTPKILCIIGLSRYNGFFKPVESQLKPAEAILKSAKGLFKHVESQGCSSGQINELIFYT